MSRIEDRQFEQFQRTGEAGALAKAFDYTAPELWRVAWYLSSGDSHRAEDALQSTFLTAIEKRDSWDSSRPLRPWLLGILANHVRNDRRRAKRASGTDDLIASLPSDQQPIDAAEQAEVRARVSAAIGGLHNPYREVVTLHIEHGLSAEEIATALDRKAGTVRTQIARGLELLRKALPVGIAVGATMALPDAASAAQVLQRVRMEITARMPIGDLYTPVVPVAHSAWKGYAMIASLLVIASAATYAMLPSAAPSIRSTTLTSLEPVVIDSSLTERESQMLLPKRTVVEAPVQDSKPNTFTVKVHVLDNEGQPVPYAPLQTQRDQRMSFVSANERGIAVFADLPSSPSPLQVAVVGRRTSHSFALTDPPFLIEKDLIIDPGMHLTVRVVDRFGQPVAGALVEGVLGNQWQRMYNPLGKTNAYGILRMRDVELRGQLRAYASGHQLAKFKGFSGQVGEEIDVTLTLGPRAVAIRGRVVHEDGATIPGASLAIVQFVGRLASKQYLRSDVMGRFRVDWLEPGRHLIIGEFLDGDTGYLGFTRFEHLGGSEPDVELVLRPGRRLTGTVRDSSGDPIAGASVSAIHLADGVFNPPFTSRVTTTEDNGVFLLAGLLSGPTKCSASIQGTHRSATIEIKKSSITEWNPILESPLPVRAILVDEQGLPLVGWRAHLRSEMGYESSLSISDESGMVGKTPQQWSLLPGETMGVSLHAPLPKGIEGILGNKYDYSPSFVSPPIGPSARPHLIRVPSTARADCSAGGRILASHDGAPRKAKITLRSGRWSRSYVTTHWSDLDTGRFKIAPLSPGDYELTIEVPGEPWFEHSFQVGVSEDLDLGDLRVPENGTVTVRARHADGSPVRADDSLTMRITTDGSRSWYAKRQHDGSFVARDVYQGDAEIMVWGLNLPSRRHALIVRASSQLDIVLPKPVASTAIVIALPDDQQRSDGAWPGTIRVFHAHDRELVLEKSVRHYFRGVFTRRLEFSLPLEPGSYEIEVESWDKRSGMTRAVVPGPAIVVELPEKH